MTEPAHRRSRPTHHKSDLAAIKLLCTRKKSAFALGISPRQLDYLIADGQLKTRLIGKRRLIPVAELKRFAASDHRMPARPTSRGRRPTGRVSR